MLRLVCAVCLAFTLLLSVGAAPAQSQTQYYLEEPGGEQVGPVDASAVLQRIEARQSSADTLIWTEALNDWQLITADPAFAPSFAAELTPTETLDGVFETPATTTSAKPATTAETTVPQPLTQQRPQYWVYDNGQQVGPMYDADVHARIAAGDSNGQTLIWSDGFAEWVPLTALPEFAAALPRPVTLYWVYEAQGDGKPVGPLTFEQMVDRIGMGETTRNTLVWMDGMADWVDIETIPELDQILPVDTPIDVAQATQWFLYEHGNQSGPYSEAALLNEVTIGNIGRSALVWTAGMPDWVSIEAVPLFEEAMADPIEVEKPYYVIEEGERLGPISHSDLSIRILDGLSTGDDLAWSKGLADWTPLRDFPEFADAVAAAEPPPMPSEDEPPPMPNEDEPPPMPDGNLTVTTDGPDHVIDLDAGQLELQAVVERWLPTVLYSATSAELREASSCMMTALSPLDDASTQILIDTQMSPSAEQANNLIGRYPAAIDAVNACIESVSERMDLFDALMWESASRASDDAAVQLEVYGCLRRATERLSTAHRDQVAAEGNNTAPETLAMLERTYPGMKEAVEACQVGATDQATVPTDDDNLTPPVDQPETPGLPLVPDQPQPPVDEPQPPIDEPQQPDQPEQPQPPAEDAFTAAIRAQVKTSGLPGYLQDQMVTCMVGKFSVLTDAEKQMVIDDPSGESSSAAIEAAHPGLSQSLMGCVPRT